MPHFIIECSHNVLEHCSEQSLNQMVFEAAKQSALFEESDIKVRLNSYKTYTLGGDNDAFIHVFSHIMQGRTTQQKASLSRAIVTQLCARFPHIRQIAMNVAEFEKATYCNRKML